jgi:(E)-4-hydroxy-3-methylbut-2-enyl-diphosphate synthase
VRVNPGNIRSSTTRSARSPARPRTPGCRSASGSTPGALDPRLLEKYGKATPEALVESAVWEASLFEEHDFHDFKISVKHNDPVVMVRPTSCSPSAATGRCTSASPRPARRSRAPSSRRRPSGRCSRQGIGDTIRVSLSAPPVEEVKVGNQILQSLNLRPRKLEIVSCPSCGRAQVDVYTLADEVTAGLEGMTVPLRVAVMGCVVNGPGEAREADLGVASGNGKGQIFVKGEVIKTVPESQIVETLIEEAMRLAEEMGEPMDEESAGAPHRRVTADGLDRANIGWDVALCMPCCAPTPQRGL